ncbi:MAG: phage capsid protein [Rhodospirillales bacterium]
MSNQVTTSRSVQYRNTIDILLQQKPARLVPAVRMETLQGKKGAFDRIGPTAALKRTTRHGDTPLIETPHDRRWVFASYYEWADLIDEADKVQLVGDPTSAYTQNAMYALNRSMDDEIIKAFFADATTGEEADGSAAFPAGQSIAVTIGNGGSGNVGLNAAKLKAARKLFRQNEVDPDEQLYCAITAEQFEDLLNDDEIVNRDYTLVNKLDEGEVVKFMGFSFIGIERLETDGSGYRRVPVWSRNGMLLAKRKDVTAKVTERADKSYSTQVYAAMDVGAVRMEEGKVVEIKCAEA